MTWLPRDPSDVGLDPAGYTDGQVPVKDAGGGFVPDTPGTGPDLSDGLPLEDGTAAAGVSAEASRADHVHPAGAGGGSVEGTSGIAVIEDPATSVATAHGQAEPTKENFQVTPTNNLGDATKFWIDAVDATNLTVAVDQSPGVGNTAEFVWRFQTLVAPTIIDSPVDVPGLVGWWDADSFTLADADPVPQWDDLSGEGNHVVQADPAKQPTFHTNVLNGLPAVRFDGTNDELNGTLATAISSGRTVFTVVKNPANDGAIRPWVAGNDLLMAKWSNADRWILGRTSSAGDFLEFFNSALLGTAAYWTLLLGDTVVRANGDNKAAGSIGLGILTSVVFGSLPGSALYFSGDLHEVLIYDRLLDASEVDDVEGYLAARWDL